MDRKPRTLSEAQKTKMLEYAQLVKVELLKKQSAASTS
jgi:hypothetical protein